MTNLTVYNYHEEPKNLQGFKKTGVDMMWFFVKIQNSSFFWTFLLFTKISFLKKIKQIQYKNRGKKICSKKKLLKSTQYKKLAPNALRFAY